MGKNAFAKRLRALRKKKFDTAKELAEILGIEPQTYNKYEQGRAYPKYDTLRKICVILGCDPYEMLYGSHKSKPI